MTASSRILVSRLNSQVVLQRVPFILTKYGQALDQQLKEEIKTVQFSWPGETRRRNGDLAGSPRDIVDTGAFLRSQRRRRINATTLRFTWGRSGGVTYAGIIYQGKGANYPARDWIKPALEALPIARFFAEEWRRLEGKSL